MSILCGHGKHFPIARVMTFFIKSGKNLMSVRLLCKIQENKASCSKFYAVSLESNHVSLASKVSKAQEIRVVDRAHGFRVGLGF